MGPGALLDGETCLFLLQQIWTTLSIHTSEHHTATSVATDSHGKDKVSIDQPLQWVSGNW